MISLVSSYCELIPINYKGLQKSRTNPCDMERNMLDSVRPYEQSKNKGRRPDNITDVLSGARERTGCTAEIARDWCQVRMQARYW